MHLQENWDDRRIPYFGTMPAEQKLQTQLSMQRMADLISFYHAQLWINHEKTQSDKLKHAPAFYESKRRLQMCWAPARSKVEAFILSRKKFFPRAGDNYSSSYLLLSLLDIHR